MVASRPLGGPVGPVHGCAELHLAAAKSARKSPLACGIAAAGEECERRDREDLPRAGGEQHLRRIDAMVARDLADFERVLRRRIMTLPGVGEVEANVLLSEEIRPGPLAAGALGEAASI